jgi:hypothetical protein
MNSPKLFMDLPIFAMLKKPITVSIIVRIFSMIVGAPFQFMDFATCVVAIKEPLT